MDRLSFSAQRTKDSIKLSFFCAFRERVRNHIDNPSKPPFDKGGFAWSRKRDSPRSGPKSPLSGLGGVNISSREIARASRELEPRFVLETDIYKSRLDTLFGEERYSVNSNCTITIRI